MQAQKPRILSHFLVNDIDEKKPKKMQPQFRVKSHSTAAIEKMTGMETMKNELNKQILNEVLSRKLESFDFIA